MRPETVAALAGINRDFYVDRAAEFDRTRRAPWRGWERIVDHLQGGGEHRRHSILDVGSGNGRLTTCLEARLGPRFDYLGFDASLPLLCAARRAGRPGALVGADCMAPDLPLAAAARFDLIAAFGLLHHVPSWEMRRALLCRLCEHLAPGGLLAVAFWQFASDERLARRIVDWQAYNRTADTPIDPRDVEPGDCLLRWGEAEALRYCHFADSAEAADLTGALGLERRETFRSDGASGRLNLYHVLARPADG